MPAFADNGQRMVQKRCHRRNHSGNPAKYECSTPLRQAITETGNPICKGEQPILPVNSAAILTEISVAVDGCVKIPDRIRFSTDFKERLAVSKFVIRTISPIRETRMKRVKHRSTAIYAVRKNLSNPSLNPFTRLSFMTGSIILFLFATANRNLSSAEMVLSAARGYENLRTHAYLPPDLDDEVFSELWKVWTEPERSAAEAANPRDRRRLTFSYYGLIADPNDGDGTRSAIGYIVDQRGDWTMNCLACHGGKVAGRVIPGLPNSHTALQTLSDDIRAIKITQGKPLSHLDLGSIQMPLNITDGTTNAVVFGIALGAFRNPDMTVDLTRTLPKLLHHDVDAPPFWNVRKKASLYADGFAPKTARPLMQFILLPRVTPEQLNRWEPEFGEILAWIESVEVPKYPFAIDTALAARGESLFNANCSRCHGTYGPQGKYEQQVIPLDDVETDGLRLQSLTPEHRNWMKKGWLSRYGQDHVEVDPDGYVAPPLDGIWASAPYFHNGSVPTLWHVLNKDARPIVWKRTEDGYDQRKVGLEIQTFDKIPDAAKAPSQRRRYFDTKLSGKSAKGHRFPDVLNEDERNAVLEYLKTL